MAASGQPLIAPGPERNQMAQPPPASMAGGHRIEHVRVADAAELAELIASGAVKAMPLEQTHFSAVAPALPKNTHCNQRYLGRGLR